MSGYGQPFSINRKATAAIAAYRIVKPTANDGEVTQAAAATDKLVGVSGQVSVSAAGDRIDIMYAGVVPVEYGGDVANGDLLTADADGKAVVADDDERVIGTAMEKGDAGTIGSVFIERSFNAAPGA